MKDENDRDIVFVGKPISNKYKPTTNGAGRIIKDRNQKLFDNNLIRHGYRLDSGDTNYIPKQPRTDAKKVKNGMIYSPTITNKKYGIRRLLDTALNSRVKTATPNDTRPNVQIIRKQDYELEKEFKVKCWHYDIKPEILNRRWNNFIINALMDPTNELYQKDYCWKIPNLNHIPLSDENKLQYPYDVTWINSWHIKQQKQRPKPYDIYLESAKHPIYAWPGLRLVGDPYFNTSNRINSPWKYYKRDEQVKIQSKFEIITYLGRTYYYSEKESLPCTKSMIISKPKPKNEHFFPFNDITEICKDARDRRRKIKIKWQEPNILRIDNKAILHSGRRKASYKIDGTGICHVILRED